MVPELIVGEARFGLRYQVAIPAIAGLVVILGALGVILGHLVGILGEIVEGGVEIAECGSLAGEEAEDIMDKDWELYMLLMSRWEIDKCSYDGWMDGCL